MASILFSYFSPPPLRTDQIKLLSQNQDFIAQNRGGFEVEVTNGIGHLLFFFSDEAFWIALHTLGIDDDEVADGLVVVARIWSVMS